MANALTWWLRGIRYLRHPSLVVALGEMKSRRDMLETMRAEYSGLQVRIHPEAVFENWAPERLTMEDAVAIDRGTILCWGPDAGAFGLIKIGEHTWIGPYNNFRTAGPGRITIGKRCYISQFCSFISNNHGIRRDALIQLQPHDYSTSDITVGDDVWFGVNSAVMPGAVIERGAVIAAGAVVTGRVPAYEIWGGVPARKIGERN
jgi:acetyltransferase-like isoleucine patch superfamily enzyme